MAKALPAGRPMKRRALFGLFDSEGWGWASTKAFFWLLVIIMVLGYIPDRAYYFIVSRTIDIGILGWAPVNLCPPENGSGMPCPVPLGGILPWQAAPPGSSLPQPRTNGSAAQLGTSLLYIGGSDGSAATATTFVAKVDKTVIGAWGDGPALPAGRADAAVAILTGTAYLVGGVGPDGKPTDTVWAIGINPDTSQLGTWATEVNKVKLPTLPEPRSGAAVVAVADGLLVAGGRGADGKPSATVWKSTIDKNGNLQAFVAQPSLLHPVADASIALEGTFVWVYGGSDDAGATAAVQRADYGAATAAAGSAAPGASAVAATAAPAASPAGSGAAGPTASGGTEGVIRWAVQDAANLPGPRTGAAGWAANGALYLVGGSDGTSAKRELYWALPDSTGNLTGGWRHLDLTDLPAGLVDSAPLVSGSTVVLLGGSADGAPVASSVRASLAPQAPFFRLGLVGATIPALQIGGEIGQQLGYIAAAGVGLGNFTLLVVVGWAFNHRAEISAWRDRRRREREAKAPEET